jgi:presequence protease
MTAISNFELLRDEEIVELKTRARLYRHKGTGAEVLSLSNEDENKVFGIAFRTPPKNSTGVAHILEHAVLCGSRKYPIKEPFVELLKGSMKTFLNAFTYPDKTCYPVASQNTKDFYNLIDVYLDAVFHPRLTPFILQQEGWHYEFESPGGALFRKGVVFNEMKGAYSSPDGILAERSQQSIFPDITYGLDSGGDPKRIPDLTFEEFSNFHKNHYHPSNARIFFYGDDEPEKRLEIVNEYLKDFQATQVETRVQLQSPFNEPRRIVAPFASGQEQENGHKGMVTVNWLLPETTDRELNLGLQVLQFILIGMPGSPLRKALIDSSLGTGLAGGGVENELRQMYFSTGLKGIDPQNADRVEELILNTLADLAKNGIDPDTVEAALNTIEFRLRENNTGSYPRGLVLMLRALTTWLYDNDPFAMLAFEAPLEAIKSRLKSDPSYFQKLIEQHLVDNNHRATVILTPDPDLAAREANEELEQLKRIHEGMSHEQLKEIEENSRELKRRQETPDSPEALAGIPTLKLEDLERTNKIIPIEIEKYGETKVVYHDIFTNGIAYLDVGFDLHKLPQEHLPYVALFGRTLLEMGTDKESFVTLSQRISRKTGGIRPEFFSSSVQGNGRSAAWLFLRGKCMPKQADDLMSILKDVLLTVRLDNYDRFRQMVLEEKARQEQKLIPNGHQMVNMRLRSHFSEADWAAEKMNGASYHLFLRSLAQRLDKEWPQILSTLERMREILVNRQNMVVNSTLDAENWGKLAPLVRAFLDDLPSAPAPGSDWTPDPPQPFEGLIIPSHVNYVGKGFNLYESGYELHGSIQVISGYLRNSWLWDQVRVQGGAYGAFCLFDRLSGTMTFVSYRDPNLLRTLESFNKASDFLRKVDMDEKELTKSIIGAIGTYDTYMLPDARGYVSLLRHLTGDTEEIRQKLREDILSTRVSHFRAFADALEGLREKGIVKVLGSQAKIEESSAELPERMNQIRLL